MKLKILMIYRLILYVFDLYFVSGQLSDVHALKHFSYHFFSFVFILRCYIA